MKLKIHMRSGKTLVQNNVKDWGIKYNSEQITSLSIDINWWGNRTIILGALDLNSIEAITKH